MRRPRNAKVVETSLQRGHINNGIIEIVDDSDTDEDDGEFIEDDTASGTVFRIPAKGIKLDFIDRVKQ